jgi:hypothetical protein
MMSQASVLLSSSSACAPSLRWGMALYSTPVFWALVIITLHLHRSALVPAPDSTPFAIFSLRKACDTLVGKGTLSTPVSPNLHMAKVLNPSY